jgi:predicted DNA-binding protein (UPF0251 family)
LDFRIANNNTEEDSTVISPHPLDRLVEQDTFAEALALLEPEELVIASLRLEALSDDQIASLLGIDRATVCRRMEQARQRIVEALPELGPVLRHRRHPPLRCWRPLERGWICPSIGGEADPQASGSLGFRHSAPPVQRYIRGLSRQTSGAGPQR